jgi:site-specific DNA recombinase
MSHKKFKAADAGIGRRFFIYARKSTESEDRQVRSIGDQLAELRELASREGIDIVEELVESQTAKRPGRPVFNEMLQRIEKGEATGILAWHPDRLARNSIDGGKIIHLVDTSVIKELKFYSHWFEPTPQGKFMLAIAFGQSKYYVDNLSENIRRGQRQKARSGIWPQWAPLGYINNPAAKGIIPDPDRAAYIHKAYELYATGNYTLDELTERVNQLGMTSRVSKQPLFRTQYYRLLQNPIYCGLFRFGGELYEGIHARIVTKELFDVVQDVLRQRSKAKEEELKPFLYRGMFRCGECGCFITTETQKGNNYLRCTKRVKKDCSQAFLREDRLQPQITQTLKRVTISDEAADWMLGALAEEQRQASDAHAEQLRTLAAKEHQCNTKLERLLSLHLEESLTADEYREAKARVLHQKLNMTEQRIASEHAELVWFEPLIKFIKAQQRSHFMATYDGKIQKERDFLKTTGSNLIIQDKALRVEFQEPWNTLEKYGRLAQRNTAPSHDGAVLVAETDHIFTVAEEQGFEPWRPLRAYRFSRPAHSTTLPLLRVVRKRIQGATPKQPPPRLRRGGGEKLR